LVLFRLVFALGFFSSGFAVSSLGSARRAGFEGGAAGVSSVGGGVDGGEGGRTGLVGSGMDIIGFGLKAYPKIANIKPKAAEITVIAILGKEPGVKSSSEITFV